MSETPTMVARGFNDATFDAFLATRNEPGWLIDVRRSAWQAFQEMPMPSRSDEEWMRTDIRAFKLDQFGFPNADAESTPEAAPAVLGNNVDLAGTASTVNGIPQSAKLDDRWQAKGVVFGGLAETV